MATGLRLAALAAALSIAGAVAGAPPAAGSAPRVGVMDDACAAVEPAPAVVVDYMRRSAQARAAHMPVVAASPDALKIYAEWQQRLLVSDFAGLCHYQAANAKLPPASDHRVVFFGDSITELWGPAAPELFRGDTIDRGVSGQTTEQMLVRFRADVVDLHPKLVHIMAGTNDIAGNTGPTQLSWIEKNIETMVEIARAHHIRVVLGAIPPSGGFKWRPDIAPAETIAAYNRWLADFARSKGVRFVDYHSLLSDGRGGIRADLSEDGTHPNAAGFRVMVPAALGAMRGSNGVEALRSDHVDGRE